MGLLSTALLLDIHCFLSSTKLGSKLAKGVFTKSNMVKLLTHLRPQVENTRQARRRLHGEVRSIVGDHRILPNDLVEIINKLFHVQDLFLVPIGTHKYP